MKIFRHKTLQLVLFLILLLLVWQTIVALRLWPVWLLPTPGMVESTLIKGFMGGSFGEGILISLKRLFIGFGLSLLLGSVLGFLLAKSKLLKNTLGFVLLGLQTLPSICWIPLALLWFGLNETAIIFVIVMGALFSITISVEDAVRSVPQQLINAGIMLGVKGGQMYTKVIFPAILPAYITGVKQGWSFAWRSLMSGEMLFITAGLGQLLMFGRELNDMSQVIAVMIIIVVLGVLFDQLIFGTIEHRIRKIWGLELKKIRVPASPTIQVGKVYPPPSG